MKNFTMPFLASLLISTTVLAQNAANTPVQGGGSLGGLNSGDAATGQGTMKTQENRIKNSNSAAGNSALKSNAATGQQLPAADRSKQYTDALKQVLKLNDDQYGKLKNVNTDFIRQIDKLTQTSKDNIAFQQGIMEADRVRVEKYRGILNAKQLKMYTDNPQLSGLTGNNEAVRADNGKPETETSAATEAKPASTPVVPKGASSTSH